MPEYKKSFELEVKPTLGEIKLTPEQAEMKEKLLRELQRYIDYVEHVAVPWYPPFRFKDSVPQGVLLSPEIQSAAKEAIYVCLQRGLVGQARGISDKFGCREEVIQSAAEEGLIYNLEIAEANRALIILDSFHLSERFTQSPEVQSAATKGLIICLNHGWAFAADKINFNFHLSKELLQTPEVQSAAVEGMIGHLRGGRIKEVLLIRDGFHVSKEAVQSPEVQSAAAEGMVTLFQGSDIDHARQIRDEFKLSKEAIQSAAKEGFISLLSHGDLDEAIKMQDEFHFTKELLQTPEVQSVAVTGINRLLREMTFKDVIRIRDEFNVSEEIVKSEAGDILRERLERDHVSEAVDLAVFFDLPNTTRLKKAGRIFGAFVTAELWRDLNRLFDGNSVPAFVELGVKKTGEAGALELERILRGKRHEFLFRDTSRPDVLAAIKNPAFSAVAKGLSRFSSSEWGAHDEDTWQSMLETYERLAGQGKLAPLPKEYTPSDTLQITMLEETAEEFTYSKDFLDRFGPLVQDINVAQERVRVHPEGGFGKVLISHLEGAIQAEIRNLEERREYYREVQADPNKAKEKRDVRSTPYALKNIEQQISALNEIADPAKRAKLSNQEVFSRLTTVPGTDRALRQTVFAFSLYLNPSFREKHFGPTKPEAPSEGDVSHVIEFVDHITNQETFAKYFTDEKAKKRFGNLLGVSTLEQEAGRLRSHRTISKKTMPLAIVPSRDLKTELSGHMADACWANKEDSVLKKHPNFISLTFVENPGHEVHERVAGACLLIETKTKDGTPLIVIRGLNPIENVATRINVADFFKKLTDYLRPIADARGCELTVVVDDHRGGSASNRAAVFGFLSRATESWVKIRLASKKDTYFNEYDIKGDTYLVP